jgi:RNA polymerase sigma factor (sigma-70 family)
LCFRASGTKSSSREKRAVLDQYKGQAETTKQNRELTQESLKKLLLRFDSDIERAAPKYQNMHIRISKFFECQGGLSPYDLTDETFSRVARKIDEGHDIPSSSLSAYIYSVAHNVLRESFRSPERKTVPIEEAIPSQHPSIDPAEIDRERQGRVRLEQRLVCLEECINKFPPETKTLILSYYQGEEDVKIRNRRRLAEVMGIPLNNLRTRIHRVREKLEQCIVKCVSNLPSE